MKRKISFPSLFCILVLIVVASCSEYDLERIGFLQVITVGISDLGTNSVTLVGNTENLREASIEESGFVLSGSATDDASLRIENSSNIVIKSDRDVLKEQGVFLSKVSGLESGTSYFYRAYLKIQEESAIAYGAIDSFTTPELNIVIESIEGSNPGCPTSALVNLEVSISGIDVSDIEFGIAWRNDILAQPTLTDDIIPGDQIVGQGKATVQIPITNCNDLYSVRAFIQVPGNENVFSSEKEFSLQEGGVWQEVGTIPQEFEKQACVHGFGTSSKGYVIGIEKGTPNTILWAFDPISFTWQQKENPDFSFTCGNLVPAGVDRNYIQPAEFLEEDESWLFYDVIPFPFASSFDGFFINNRIYVKSSIFSYFNILNVSEEKELQDYPGKGFSLSTFIIGGKGYMGMGFSNTEGGVIEEIYNDFWAFDFLFESWTAVADMPDVFRANDISFSMNGRGYVLTGYDENDVAYSGFWEYNPITDQWTRLADYGRGDGNADVGFVIDGIAYGGMGATKDGIDRNEFWKYVPGLE